jgi:hypothetical protein
MFGFLKNFFSPGQTQDSDFDRSLAESASSLDIQVAITAHENWKLRLMTYLDGKSSEVFDPQVICFDDRCDLGKWIHGPGQERLGKYPGFTALMNNHKMFHYSASNVVSLTKVGKAQEARKMLDGQFSSFSAQVVGALQELQQALERRKSK